MAEGVLFNIASEILNVLGSQALQEIKLICGFRADLRRLEGTVSTIKAVLLDAEEKQATDHQVKDWLKKLKDAFDDANNLLDEFSAEILLYNVMAERKRAKEVRIFFSSSNQFLLRLKMGHKIKAINENLNEIAQDRRNFHLVERLEEGRVQLRKERETHSFIREEEVIGRKDDKEKILKLLLDTNIQENVGFISIVGIGGAGKTTLAQLLYNDDTIKGFFELKLWVCVSGEFELKLIGEKIIESETGAKPNYLQIDLVQNHVRKLIDGKKYLLVLDDVWNQDRNKWMELRDLLMGGVKGSKVLVTTRLREVANITGTIDAYELGDLSEEEAWVLFKKTTFKQGKEPDENSPIGTIAKDIVKKCARVPLAIKSIGSLLYDKNTIDQWVYFKNNDLPKIAQRYDTIMPILRLSYDHLPSNLKHCFAYCSLYLKDQPIEKNELIRMWIAQGFIQPSDEDQDDLEEEGDLYFMNLLVRCFFQDVEYVEDVKDISNNAEYYKMHDLMHDLAQSVAGSECVLANLDGNTITPRNRHVSFDFMSVDQALELREIPTPLLDAKRLSTFFPLFFDSQKVKLNESCLNHIISSFRWLRVLSLCNFGIETVPNSISKLKCLRYLDLSYNSDLKTLPKSITKLQNLQTLDLGNCDALKELPREISKIASLRHVLIRDCNSLRHLPSGIGQLSRLRLLDVFVVSHDGTRHNGSVSAGLCELKGLHRLRGSLQITYLGRLRRATIDVVKKEVANPILKDREFLTSVELSFKCDDDCAYEQQNVNVDELVLHSLQPHSNLRALVIQDYNGTNFPSWMILDTASSLQNIVNIEISHCQRCQHIPQQLGRLPSLQSLSLMWLNSVEYIDDGDDVPFPFFPSLEFLYLSYMPNLKGWWRRRSISISILEEAPAAKKIISFPRLSQVHITYCPQLTGHMPLISSCVEDLELQTVSEKLLRQLLLPGCMLPTSSLPSSSSSSSSSSSLLVPLSKMRSLAVLSIQDLVSLPEEWFQNLISLQSLTISSCDALCSITGALRHLTALQTLEISNCKELDLLAAAADEDEAGNYTMQFQGLRSLTSLSLGGSPKLVSLPLWFQHLTTLQSVKIEHSDNLMSLPEWIGSLTSLQLLCISRCPQVTSLPESMKHLTALTELRIWECPLLEERCRKETGEDWPKIAHIPDFAIRYESYEFSEF